MIRHCNVWLLQIWILHDLTIERHVRNSIRGTSCESLADVKSSIQVLVHSYNAKFFQNTRSAPAS